MTITQETRAAAHEEISPKLETLEARVYTAVLEGGGLTAEEIHHRTGINLNSSRSRATELYKSGRFAVLSKRANTHGRLIAVYSVAQAAS